MIETTDLTIPVVGVNEGSPTLAEAASAYLAHLRARGLANATIKSRAEALAQLSESLGDLPVAQVSPTDVDAIFDDPGWCQSTRNLRMAQYKGFFSFCRNRGFIPLGFEPMHGWRSLTSGTPREHQRIPVEKWGELLDECVHPTERALVALGLYLFLRSSEIQQLRVSSVDLESNTIEIRRVKTRDWDIMPICLELAVELREYLDWYSSQNGYSPDAFLIPARGTDLARDPDTNRLLSGTGSIETSRPIGRPHVTVQRILTSANLPTSDEGMHSLRRAGSRALFDSLVTSGYDGALKRVQSMLGHRSAKVTETYLGLDVDRRSRNQALASAPMFPPRVISPERQAS